MGYTQCDKYYLALDTCKTEQNTSMQIAKFGDEKNISDLIQKGKVPSVILKSF